MSPARVELSSLFRRSGEDGVYTNIVNLLFLASVVFLICVGVAAAAMGSIKADQVGILVNNLTGAVRKVDPGTCFYNSIVSDLYVIDRSQQTVEMKRAEHRGKAGSQESDSDEKGSVKIKTIDGSDVSADIIINYLIDPEQVIKIAEDSGPMDAYKEKWVKDYARSLCRNIMGELTTEEFYDSLKRDEKSKKCQAELNKELRPWGIQISAVQVQDFGFYHEYEQKIREKKLADQEVEEQKSQAKAGAERLKRVRIEEDSKVAVEVAQFKGDMDRKLVEADAQAAKAKLGADAYSYSTKVDADALFYQSEKRAQGIRATREAEANGMKSLAEALVGGRNLVLLEYAKRLQTMHITGQPMLLDSRMERLQHFGSASVTPASGAETMQGSPGTAGVPGDAVQGAAGGAAADGEVQR